jgi:hypothetical protein
MTNTCGFEHGLTRRFTDEDPNELEIEYRFSEWYDIIKGDCYTPISFLCSYSDLFNGKIDEIIQTLPGKCCFARLDILSSKPTSPYFHSEDIISDFSRSSRTAPYFTEEMPIVIREYVLLTNIEFRCFVHGRKLRAISTEGPLRNMEEIVRRVNSITFLTDYDDYCVDFTYHADKLMLIEINTPVWLFACSGLFCLDIPYDVEILMGEYMPDILNYPIVRRG